MQIQLTISEEFSNPAVFAEFSAALADLLNRFKSSVSNAATKVHPLEAPYGGPNAPAPVFPADAYAEFADTLPPAATDTPPAPATEAAPVKAKRGRPPAVKPAAEVVNEPVALPSAPAEVDPFGDVVAAAPVQPSAPVTPTAPAADVPITADLFRPLVLKLVELRPDRAAAALEWTGVLREFGYASNADITNRKPDESDDAMRTRVAPIVAKLREMIAKAEAAKAAAKAK